MIRNRSLFMLYLTAGVLERNQEASYFKSASSISLQDIPLSFPLLLSLKKIAVRTTACQFCNPAQRSRTKKLLLPQEFHQTLFTNNQFIAYSPVPTRISRSLSHPVHCYPSYIHILRRTFL